MPPRKPPSPSKLSGPLLAWYDRQARRLPWRAEKGQRADPYHVWLSEIMLQQTTVAAVLPYYERFLARWPTIQDLAATELDEVLSAWAGLGYYARARNLHRCAKEVAERFAGRFPQSEEALRELPGIGPYTAAAIAAIAFDRPAAPLDGNWERVLCRVFAIEEPLEKAKPALRRLAKELVPERRAGDFAQAMMDLGATLCQPRQPRCGLCPLAEHCRAKGLELQQELPRRLPKKPRPLRRAVAFWLERDDGRVLLRRRPEAGLLGGMIEVPSTEWRAQSWSAEEARCHAPEPARWRPLPGRVRHVFTHFELEVEVWVARTTTRSRKAKDRWSALESFGELALPSVMRKIAAHAIKARDLED